MSVLISIIVPVYNSEQYLRRCLDSLVNQQIKEMEIIVVDNGSTDSSLQIIQKYTKKHPQLVFVHTTEHSNYAGAGRNYEIEIARGQYIGFCDSDDFVEPDYYGNMLKVAILENGDIVFSPFFMKINGKESKVFEMNNNLTIEYLLSRGNNATWNKIYRSDIIKRIKFPIDFSFEDFAWYVSVVTYCKTLSYCKTPGYHYIIRNDSETMVLNSDKTLGREFGTSP